MVDNKELGRLIRKIRIGCNLTPSDLGVKIGKTESSIKKYEYGQTTIPIGVLQNVCAALGCDLELTVKSGLKKYTIK